MPVFPTTRVFPRENMTIAVFKIKLGCVRTIEASVQHFNNVNTFSNSFKAYTGFFGLWKTLNYPYIMEYVYYDKLCYRLQVVCYYDTLFSLNT